MLAQWAAEGHREPLLLGGPDSQRLWEAVAGPPPSGQRHCALPECGIAGDRLQACSRCRAAFYWYAGRGRGKGAHAAGAAAQRACSLGAPTTCATTRFRRQLIMQACIH